MPDQPNQNISTSAIFGWPMTNSFGDVWTRSYMTDNMNETGFAGNPSDTVTLTQTGNRLLLGQGGDVNVIDESGNTVLLQGLAPGIIHTLPFRIQQILATGTTAGGITVFG